MQMMNATDGCTNMNRPTERRTDRTSVEYTVFGIAQLSNTTQSLHITLHRPGERVTTSTTISVRYLSVPIHLNWKGMLHDSNLFVVPNTEAEAVDGGRDDLLADAVHITMQETFTHCKWH